MINTVLKSRSLYSLWMLLVLLILFGVVLNSYLSLVAFLLLISALLFMSSNDAMVLLIALVPLANIFKINTEATSLFTIAEIFMVLLLVLKRKKVKTSFFLTLMLLSIYMLVFSFENMDVLLIIKISVGFLLIYYSMEIISQEDVKNITCLLSFDVLIMMGLTLNNYYLKYVLPYYDDVNYLVTPGGGSTDVLRASGFFGDPNYCAALIVIVLSMLCLLYYYKKISDLFWVLFISIAILGSFTYSKSYFLCISALILLLLLFVLFPKHKGWAIISTLAVIIVISMALNGKIEVFNIVWARFSSGDITSGRSQLNNLYLAYIWENPKVFFFGEGIATDRIAGSINNVHNIYIESYFKLGLVGCLIYVCALLTSIKFHKSVTAKRKIVNFLPLIFFAILFYALAGITMYELPFYIAIVFLAKDFNLLDDRVSHQKSLQGKNNEKV